ncbi:MAG: adenosylcobinamide-phosphate synthase CbiB [Corynebacterium sp.]|uniref:adenosylcobinamide-phosphate synthase CbiB n=1 Tax=Corynebacterium sp. TaxID=1720 RepID=UPI0026DB19A2|nr:adenosylcobinamide-phosphate synthase CbiB [Corynebacterium sp.]MDO4760923.1 adenosylcobinamide-phosphate synthase CbiB [Corynebacterium sp.]
MSLAIIAGMAADRVLGDPGGSCHPVALFGRSAAWLEKYMYSASKSAGAIYVAACVLPPVAASVLCARRYPKASLGVSLCVALGGSTLETIGERMATRLERGDVEAARELVPWLCSRDPKLLDADGIARATVESLAENTSDAAIAPIVWALCGAPGVVLHRTVNTLDAMVGYRNERYEQFGWAAAKFDDVLAYIPARVTAVAHVVLARGRWWEAVRAWREDACAHPSPNAGPVEATAAAALGVQLGGKTQYAHGVEMRPVLGTGATPTVADVRKAVRLSRNTQFLVAAAVSTVRWVVVASLRRATRSSAG